MRVLIQHNFNTGLGDMYCSVTEYINYVSNLRLLGYKTELLISFKDNKFVDIIDFSEIFDMSFFKIFDNIGYTKDPIIENEYNGLKYVYTPNLYTNPRPGQQLWDIFIDHPIEIAYPVYTPYKFLVDGESPNIIPKFNEKIYNLEKEFLKKINSEYNFFHLRMSDNKVLNDDDFRTVNNFMKKLEEHENVFHVGSNNQQVIKLLHKLNNVIVYDFKINNEFDNDYGYFIYNNLSYEDSIDRLCNNLSEMVSIRNAIQIYQYSEFSWISNFIYYSLIENQNNPVFISVDKNFEKK